MTAEFSPLVMMRKALDAVSETLAGGGSWHAAYDKSKHVIDQAMERQNEQDFTWRDRDAFVDALGRIAEMEHRRLDPSYFANGMWS